VRRQVRLPLGAAAYVGAEGAPRGVCLLFDRIRLDAVLEAVLEDREAFHVDDVRYTEARIAGRPARRGGRRLHRDTPGLLLPQEERLPD
jgi:hypothetical protein